jgi:hypothetical protein
MRKISAMIAMGVVLAFATSASAGHRSHHYVPPGNSGIDQYTESIPGAGGNHPTSGGHGGGGGNPSAVSPSVIRTLNSQGPAGRGAARLATATAPNLRGTGADSTGGAGRNASAGNGGGSGAASGGNVGSERGTSGGNDASGSAGSGSGARAIGAELTGSGADTGMGIWLPIILGSTLAAALAFTVLRWRRESRRPGTG